MLKKNLKEYQKQAIAKSKTLDKMFLFMACGTGKTLTALHSVEGRCLVLAPPKVVKAKVWEKENEGLNKDIVVKSLFDKNVSYSGFDMLIVDECHRVKNPQAQISKRVKRIAQNVKRVLGLTGTWSSNGYWDTWGMSISLDIDMFQERTKNAFLEHYYHTWTLPSNCWVILPTKLREGTDLFTRIENKSFIYIQEYENYSNNIIYCQGALSKEYKLAQQSVLGDKTLTALTKVNALRCLSNGFYYDNDKVIHVDDVKKECFFNLYSMLKSKGRKVIVVYTYTADAEGLNLMDEDIAIQESSAEGLNLQHYDTIIFYNATYSYQNYEQARKRILRLGQDKHCLIFTLVRKGTIDEVVERKKGVKIDASDLLKELI